MASSYTTSDYSAAEQALRVDLAACYRLIHRYGMDDMIYTHISARLPGPEHHFLINPYGLMFDEITASNLVVIDLEGKSVYPTDYDVNPAGFTIHSAIHSAREDVCCVLHTHTTAGMAVSALQEGLLPINQTSMAYYDALAYHDYEGIALDLSERERLVRDLGHHDAMILRNHGLLTCGQSVAEAFDAMYYLEMSCRTQLAAQKSGAELILPSAAVCEHTRAQSQAEPRPRGQRLWQALLRKLDRECPDYRD